MLSLLKQTKSYKFNHHRILCSYTYYTVYTAEQWARSIQSFEFAHSIGAGETARLHKLIYEPLLAAYAYGWNLIVEINLDMSRNM